MSGVVLNSTAQSLENRGVAYELKGNGWLVSLRAAVKRLLKKYKYPPDRQESAVSLVIEQAELLAQEQAA